MDQYPETLQRLIEALTHLPTIGRKSAQRLALYLADRPPEEVERLAMALLDTKDKITHCSICNNLADTPVCRICEDTTRDESVLCVVENVTELIAIEKTKSYRGRYHVLGGLLNPMAAVGPMELHLDVLAERVAKEDIQEVVLAFGPTVEGDLTAGVLQELLQEADVKITRIASGIPIGASLEYFDDITLIRALEDRRAMPESL